MTTPPGAGACTWAFRDQHASAIAADVDHAAAAAAAADWKQATASAARVQAGALYLHHSVIRDALAEGLDWHQVGELLGVHPRRHSSSTPTWPTAPSPRRGSGP